MPILARLMQFVGNFLFWKLLGFAIGYFFDRLKDYRNKKNAK